MAIIQHPLAAQELGSFIEHHTYNAAPEGERPDWQVRFLYEHGTVNMRVSGNSYLYRTQITADEKTAANCYLGKPGTLNLS